MYLYLFTYLRKKKSLLHTLVVYDTVCSTRVYKTVETPIDGTWHTIARSEDEIISFIMKMPSLNRVQLWKNVDEQLKYQSIVQSIHSKLLSMKRTLVIG